MYIYIYTYKYTKVLCFAGGGVPPPAKHLLISPTTPEKFPSLDPHHTKILFPYSLPT